LTLKQIDDAIGYFKLNAICRVQTDIALLTIYAALSNVSIWPSAARCISRDTRVRPEHLRARAYDASSQKRMRLASPRIGPDSAFWNCRHRQV